MDLKHLISLSSLFLTVRSLPTGPDGADIRVACLTSFAASPVCKDLIANDPLFLAVKQGTNLRSQDPLCLVFCDAGVQNDGCECEEDNQLTTVAQGNNPATTTTDMCVVLCSMGEGGTLCQCENLPPARNLGEEAVPTRRVRRATKNARATREGICYHACGMGLQSDICGC